ncbi:MAG: BCCT family transporter [Halobacteriales archaeon]
MADGEDEEAVGEMSEGLQVELFHPESDREPGDTNIQRWGFDVHPIVFPVSLALIALFVVVTIGLGDQAASAYDAVFNYINSTFGWFYIIAVNIFIISILYFGLSKYGSIRIGGVEAEKEFSDFAWMAMLFSAGMGIGLMFFSVAEPMFHINDVPPALGGVEAANTPAAATAAMAQTFFHWGFHPWAVYGLVGLGLAFFSFNRGLPLTFRSIFWPLLGERIYGWPGHLIDLVTVFATMFGLATSLGLGVAQVNSGLNFIASDLLGAGGVPVGITTQIVLIAVITGIAVMSVAAGLDGGVKRLSTLNLYLMFILLAFMIVVGPTTYIMGVIGDGLSAYFGNFFELAFFTGTIASGAELVGVTDGYTVGGFMGAWTVFYWGWWIAWSPFVGMFIARISRGRTVREFVMGVLFLPSLFSFVWLGAFGGAALNIDLAEEGIGPIAGLMFEIGGDAGQAIAMFAMLDQYPLTLITAPIATLLVLTFFVTSSDSGSLVIDHLTSGGKHDVPRAQRIFWASTEGVVAAVLLWGGGVAALQTAAISTGLPFAVILLLMVFTVYQGLSNEYEILESEEFADRISQMTDEEGVEVVTESGEVVTGVSSGDEPAD